MSRPAGLVAAVRLLTRWPVPGDRNTSFGVAWFPLIGAVIGLLGGGIYWLAELALPRILSATIALTTTVVITGALHEDGLADYADALGATGGEEALAILRDPRVGAFGALALVVSIVWRVAAIAALEPGQAFFALPMAHSMSRSAAAALLGATPARSEGLGRSAADSTSRGEGAVSVLGGVVVGTAAGGVWAAPAAGVAALVLLQLRRSAQRRLGGLTGDVLGACQQMVEVAVLTLAVIAVELAPPVWDGLL